MDAQINAVVRELVAETACSREEAFRYARMALLRKFGFSAAEAKEIVDAPPLARETLAELYHEI